jgi:NAD(P)-dependent dehydrogenase (short-subunit alcohol dehydrogenase family)
MPTDRTIVVTGSSGIAAAGAIEAVRRGAAVFVIGREADEVAALIDQLRDLGGDADGAVADLCDEVATSEAFARCQERFGRVDGLLAVAGGSGRAFGDGPLHELTLDAWGQTLRLNGHPTMLAVGEVLRLMLRQDRDEAGERGAIVVVSSVLATSPSPQRFGTAAYVAVKGAQLALVRHLAATHAIDGIRVNALAPGLVATPMARRAAADPDTVAYAARKQPLAGGLLPAEAIASAAVYLLGAPYVTGQVLAVDGGWGVTEAAP